MPLLRELSFVDLFIGDDFADIKAGAGAYAPRRPVEQAYLEEIDVLRTGICKRLDALNDEECSYEHDGVVYRVTRMRELRESPVLFLRRMHDKLWSLKDVRLPAWVAEHVIHPATKGMILVCGDMGSGKTTTATSIFTERIGLHGSFGLALEQPPEYALNGEHGRGRCIQVPVTRRNGGFERQLQLAKRTSTSELLIGEIRCGETGTVAVSQTNVGTTVISTIHAKGVIEAITQLEAFALQGGMRDPLGLISRGLCCVIHQKVSRVGPAGQGMMMSFDCLVVGGKSEQSIRQKISDPGRLSQLKEDLHNQRQQAGKELCA